jgi:predicted alpha/beta superfamily hydrolase
MKYRLLFTALLFFSIIISAQEVRVTFEVANGKPDDTSSVFITGNESKLGDWDPSIVKLNKGEDNIWSVTLSFPQGTKLEYKFTLGSWSKEALNNKGEVQGNLRLTVFRDTIVHATINNWGQSLSSVVSFKGQITGTVKYHRNFKTEGLSPRDIIVWLPPSYKKDESKRYPVLYAHDGQNLFDPSTSSFGTDWQLDETADSLIKQDKIDEIIIVGIYCTRDRMREYAPGDFGTLYMDFIVKQLKPFVDKTYRTLPDRENTATMGSSAGGLISFMLLWVHNDIFSKAACMSPAFKISHLDYIAPVLNYAGNRKDIKVYIDCGGVGLDSLLQPGSEMMISTLKGKGYVEGKDYSWFYDRPGEHNEQNWARRVWRPLEFIYGKK